MNANYKYNERSEQKLQQIIEELSATNKMLIEELDKHKREKTLLRRTKGTYQMLVPRLLAAQEQEKKLISSVLHDGVSQHLSLIKFNTERKLRTLEADELNASSDVLNDIVVKTQTALNQIRCISMQLRPSTLDDIGILATLGWFCREFEFTHPHIVITKQVSLDENQVKPALKTVVFRVVQEAFNNLAEHADANQASLKLSAVGQDIELEIADNGRGIQLNESLSHKPDERGVGLHVMRARVECSNGHFSIESSRSRGTIIKACWPQEAKTHRSL